MVKDHGSAARRAPHVLDGRAFARGLKQRSIHMAQKRMAQQQGLAPVMPAKKDAVACGMEEMQRIFAPSKVTPVRVGRAIPVNAQRHVIYFGDEELRNVGATVAAIEADGFPLGTAQRTFEVREEQFVHPAQKKLFQQRRKIYHHLMDDASGSGNLLSASESSLYGMTIFEQHGSHRSFVWCGDDFEASSSAEPDEEDLSPLLCVGYFMVSCNFTGLLCYVGKFGEDHVVVTEEWYGENPDKVNDEAAWRTNAIGSLTRVVYASKEDEEIGGHFVPCEGCDLVETDSESCSSAEAGGAAAE